MNKKRNKSNDRKVYDKRIKQRRRGTAKIKIRDLIPALAFSAFFVTYQQNNTIDLESLDVSSPRLPHGLDGLKILQLSDLHDRVFGYHHRRLYRAIAKSKPDLIVITGDLIDRRRTLSMGHVTCFSLLKQIKKIAPIYYIPGNHEAASLFYEEFTEELVALGIVVLENKEVYFPIHQEKLRILGAKDPNFYHAGKPTFRSHIKNLHRGSDEFTLLLAHRPEELAFYASLGIDLVLCGHAHGGQFRFPGIPGLFSPNQGFFPPYTNGLYQKNKTQMVVSRGLGNSVIPLRILNRPHLIQITLRRESIWLP